MRAQHLLHRHIKRIILVRCHVSAAAARVRTPLYRIAALGFKRRHGGKRGGIWLWGGSPRRGSPLPVPLLRLDVRLRSGKRRAGGWSVHPRWWCRRRRYRGHYDGGGSGSSGRGNAPSARPTSAGPATSPLKGQRSLSSGGVTVTHPRAREAALWMRNKGQRGGVCAESVRSGRKRLSATTTQRQY